jgi:predicted ATPase
VPELPTGTVTFLFTDIEGSTRLLHELGAEDYAEALAEHRGRLREAIAAHDGVEVDTQGDAFFVVFPKAVGALAAAEQACEALAEGPIRVRMGIHSGEPLVTAEGYVGIDVHRGARVMSAGHGGQVLVSEATYRLLGDDKRLTDLGLHRLKDLTEPQPLYQLGSQDFPPLKTLYQTNLPVQPTPLVGREQELAEVLALLSGVRLVTLTGAGGSGKTRLALQAAAELVDDYPQGVWWVSLAALRDPELVEPTIAKVLGVKDGLAEHLRSQKALLLLDNFEQLVEAAPRIASLLSEAPELRLLVTSRERLGIGAEHEYPVPTLVADEAIALFTTRARQLKPGFEPDEAVAEICRRLDGLPLAVELAAARVKVLRTEQILERLGRSLELLTAGPRDAPERQRTLRATIEWSYDLLDEDEKDLFARLAVFAGSFDLDAAQAVCDAGLDSLAALVDKSLLRQTEDGRFFLLETIREYALARIASSGEAADLQRRHAGWFLELAEDARRGVLGPEQGRLFDVLDREHDNLRAALEWAERESDHELLLRLTSSLGYFWALRGHVEESRVRLARALAAPLPPGREDLRASILCYAADDARLEGRVNLAEEHATEAVELARRGGDDTLIGRALSMAGVIAGEVGDIERGEQLQLEALDHFRACEDGWGQMAVFTRLTDLALKGGDLSRAERVATDSLTIAEAVGEQSGIGVARTNLAIIAVERHRPDEAKRHATEALRHFTAVGEQEGTSTGLELLAAALDDAQPREAARLLGLAAVLREALGTVRGSPEQSLLDRTLERVRGQLGTSEFASVFDSVRDLDPAAVMAEAALKARALD